MGVRVTKPFYAGKPIEYISRGDMFCRCTQKDKDQEEQQSKTLAKMHREELLRRQAALEIEIDLLYPIPKRIRRDSEKEVE